MNRFWEDAAGILETACAAREDNASEIAILIDRQQNLRIVDAAGWQLDALRREYQASTAYAVKRNATAIVVEAQNGADRGTLKKVLQQNPLTALQAAIPYHLVRPAQPLLQS